jgi:hypothetical protein
MSGGRVAKVDYTSKPNPESTYYWLVAMSPKSIMLKIILRCALALMRI